MSKEEKCTPSACGGDALELKNLLTQLRESALKIGNQFNIQGMSIETLEEEQIYDTMINDLKKEMRPLSKLIEAAEKNCQIDLKELKSANNRMENWLEKEQWFAFAQITANAIEDFEENLTKK